MHTGDILRFGYDSILYTFKYEEYVQQEQQRKLPEENQVVTENTQSSTGGHNLDDLLKVLESRISELEKFKKHPSYPLLELDTIEKALLVKIFHFSNTLLNQQELVAEQGHDKISMLEVVCKQLETCVGNMYEQHAKINEFEQYSKTLERKVSDFRVKLWEMEQLYDQTKNENRILQEKCAQFEIKLKEHSKQQAFEK